MSREILKTSGEPEGESVVQELEERAQKEQGHASFELLNFFEKVDFPTLRGMFEDISERSGGDPKALNFIEPDRITYTFPNVHHGVRAAYRPEENLIMMRYHMLREFAQEKLQIPVDLLALSVLCHEEVHATSRVECRGLEIIAGRPRYDYIRVGYFLDSPQEQEKDEGVDKGRMVFLRLFEEGVTDKLGQEIFREYVRRTEFADKKTMAEFDRAAAEHGKEFLYVTPMKFVDALIAKISRETGISRRVVWQAIVRGKYEGEDLANPELREAFAEMVSPYFLDRLSRANSDEELQKLMVELE